MRCELFSHRVMYPHRFGLLISSERMNDRRIRQQRSILVALLTTSLCFLPWIARADDETDDRSEYFETWIRPVLIDRCYECHSAEADEQQGGLQLDSAKGLLEGGDSGPAVAPGEPENSLILEVLSYSNLDLQMPPDERLSKDVVDRFRKWIEDGAYDPRQTNSDIDSAPVFNLAQRRDEHWAWQPITREFSPDASVDHFINRELAQRNIEPAPRADAQVLVRRLYYDLIGLPPSPDEVASFQQAYGVSPDDAIEQLVDELLSDKRYGEHWSTTWLDVIRYCETKGHVTDQERPFAWKYRDYVIQALNNDLSFDRFVTEHLAGDLLRESQWRPGLNGEVNVAPTATGALFMHEMHFMSVDPVKQRWDEINAQIEVVGKAFLGLTLDCARCHDHKFDAISQADYYALAGFFYSTEQSRARTAPRAPLAGEQTELLVQLESKYQTFLDNKREQRRKAQTPKVGSDSYFPISEELGIQAPGETTQLLNMMQELQELDPSWGQWVRSATDVHGQDVPLLVRGSHNNPGPIVKRRFLTALAAPTDEQEVDLGNASGRLYLAEQITSPHNPLTSRVWVNRLWAQLFGRGIVGTPNNFGVLGEAPTHPELLDYLADSLMTSNWSTKSVIRQIVLSDAYLRSSKPTSTTDNGNDDSDPNNDWLSRQNVRRLSAEQLRDTLLSNSQSLDSTMYGPSIDCFVPSYATANKPGNVPKSGPLDGNGRRSVYIKVRRNFRDPFLNAFDFPDRSRPIGQRQRSNGPTQALAMLNSPFVHLMAKRWGESLGDHERVSEELINRLWMTALSRPPTELELSTSIHLSEQLLANGLDTKTVLRELAHVVINHPEYVLVR